jgi:hypothetical protein
MCAGDTAFHNLDTVEVTLTREQARDLRKMMEYCVASLVPYQGKYILPYGEETKKTAEGILEQLPKESA